MRNLLALLLFVPSLCLAQNEGCTYANADNYNSLATIDDGSCTFQEGTYHHPTTISTAIFDPCGNDGLLRDEPAYSTSWTTEQYKEALTQHIEDEGYGKVLILSMEHAIVNPEFDGYGLDWTSNQTIGNEWNVSCAYSAYLTEWIPSITVAFTDPCILAACAGCMDSTALNFSNQANEDDGSCIFADELCGEGTVWDSSASTCVVAYPSDVDLDGCTGAGDVLDVLANFGGCYSPDPEVWTCGDPVTYWDYDYATVLIGDQCWFADNLRSTQYQTGDSIVLWDYEGEVDTYGLGHYTYKDLNTANADTFGLLYTWHAATHELQLCPTGWHTPSQQEFQNLMNATDVISGDLSSTAQVTALQSSSIWTLGTGSNATGFSALPGSQRTPWGGLGYGDQYEEAFWWTSDQDGFDFVNLSLAEPLNGEEKQIKFDTCDNPNDAMSIRCIQD